MLTGVHPFDVDGTSSDAEINRRVLNKEKPPLRNSPITQHLSPSSIQLIEKLLEWNPKKRLTAGKWNIGNDSEETKRASKRI